VPLSIPNLLRQLDEPEIIDWALELKNGREAYVFLINALKQDTLNVNQTVNALHALFRIRGHGSREEVLQALVESAQNANKQIRSEAVQLATGLVKLSHLADKEPLNLSEQQVKTLREATTRGLTTKAHALAADFFEMF